jgi:glycosyltransferase involved in cell wall biosynthesis
MTARPLISVIIPAHNEAHVIGACLEAALASDHGSFEVIVVDDRSTDATAAIVQAHPPCRLIRAETHLGVSRARNLGAEDARGELLFFTDADCLLTPAALGLAAQALAQASQGCAHGAVVGGTYTPEPVDPGFYNRFQAVLVNHFEARASAPDYIAAHALMLRREDFLVVGGFAVTEGFGVAAGVEDVELSHRLRRTGHCLVMDPRVLVRHHFGFDLARSLANAWRKTRVWARYSLVNRDLLADSGFASGQLKADVAAWGLGLAGLAAWALSGWAAFLALALAAQAVNLAVNRRVLAAFWRASHSPGFAVRAWLYYLLLYPLPIAGGGLAALAGHWSRGLAGPRER